MILSKLQTLLLLCAIIAICLIYQAPWIFSRTTTGEIVNTFEGGRMMKRVQYITVGYSVNGKSHTGHYPASAALGYREKVPVRYLSFAPAISRVNTPAGNWGWIIIALPAGFVFLSICFLTKELVPANSQFQLGNKFPFLVKLKQPTDSNPTDNFF
jgi:hypothetical protein